MKFPDNLIPLVYLVTVAAIGAGLKYAEVDNTTIGLIIGAGLTRVKMHTVKSDEPKTP